MPDVLGNPSLRIILFAGAGIVACVAAFVVAEALHDNETKARTATALTAGDAARAPAIFRRYGCSSCHAIPGIPGADGVVGAPLSDFSKRVYIAGVLENNSDNLITWIVSPQQVSPQSAMPDTGISRQEARDLAAYLYAH
jgi:cytochrome c2